MRVARRRPAGPPGPRVTRGLGGDDAEQGDARLRVADLRDRLCQEPAQAARGELVGSSLEHDHVGADRVGGVAAAQIRGVERLAAAFVAAACAEREVAAGR